MATSDLKEAVSRIVGIVLFVCVGTALRESNGSFFFGGERVGTVRYQDCREIVRLKDNPLRKLYTTFTCSYQRTVTGKLMGGECVSVKTTSSGETCQIAYLYEKKSEFVCPSNTHVMPDETCACGPNYMWDSNIKSCVVEKR